MEEDTGIGGYGSGEVRGSGNLRVRINPEEGGYGSAELSEGSLRVRGALGRELGDPKTPPRTLKIKVLPTQIQKNSRRLPAANHNQVDFVNSHSVYDMK